MGDNAAFHAALPTLDVASLHDDQMTPLAECARWTTSCRFGRAGNYVVGIVVSAILPTFVITVITVSQSYQTCIIGCLAFELSI